MLGTTPEREDVVQAPGEVVAGVSVDGLMKTQGNPDIDGEDVQVVREVAIQERASNGAHSEDEDLERVRELGGEAERCAISVVQLVDLAIQGAVM